MYWVNMIQSHGFSDRSQLSVVSVACEHCRSKVIGRVSKICVFDFFTLTFKPS